jgi:hypothetical protein
VLDGQGPVGASLPMRASALIAGGSVDRLAARERLEAAMELERSLMAGASGEGARELAGWVEESVRGILREAALGELGTNLGEAADETLIATCLGAGDVEIAVAAQDLDLDGNQADDLRSPEPEVHDPRLSEPAVHDLAVPEFEIDHIRASKPVADHPELPSEEASMEEDTRILEPVPAEDEIRITTTHWLDEVEVEESTLDFPAIEGDVSHRERIDTPRVRHLFPVPEDADWEVRELDYDHYEDRRTG